MRPRAARAAQSTATSMTGKSTPFTHGAPLMPRRTRSTRTRRRRRRVRQWRNRPRAVARRRGPARHQLGNHQRQHRDDDDERRTENALRGRGYRRAKNAGSERRTAIAQARRYDELQQQAAGPKANRQREAVVAPGENRPRNGEEKRRRRSYRWQSPGRRTVARRRRWGAFRPLGPLARSYGDA